MKSCTPPAALHGVVTLPDSRGRIASHAAIFQWFGGHASHWPTTSRIWVASYAPTRSNDARPASSASVPSTAPDVITGERIRTRWSAEAMRSAARCASDGPRGENTGRTSTPRPSVAGVPSPPLDSRRPFAQSCSKFRVYARATSGDETRTITFSSRENASSVQFVEPVHTSAASRTTYL